MPSTPNAASLWLALFRTTQAVDGVAQQSVRAAGLRFGDFAVLEPLLHLGPLTAGVLAQKTGLTTGSITAAVDRLRDRGLVDRTVNPSDQRSRIVELTDEGHALISAAYAMHAADLERFFEAALTAEQRQQLFGLLSAVRHSVGERWHAVPGKEL